jgi:tetratricopeptide (TPR) repeat protein
LREAAQLAKDVANQPDKAINYYQELLPLTPEDGQISQSLERLLERHERWQELIALWEGRLETQSKKDRDKSRARIAGVWLENLGDPGRALAATKPLLAVADDDREPCKLLEQIIESPSANKSVRDATLDLLRAHRSDAAPQGDRIIEGDRQILDERSSAREAGTRLANRRLAPAMDFAALLAMTPGHRRPREAQALAERGGLHDRFADGAAAAARVSDRPAGSSCS